MKNLICENCSNELSPSTKDCSVCGNSFSVTPFATEKEKGSDTRNSIPEIPIPDPNAFPLNLKSVDFIFSILIGTIFLILSFTVFNFDKDKQFDLWINECILNFQKKENWTSDNKIPKVKLNIEQSTKGNIYLDEKATNLIEILLNKKLIHDDYTIKRINYKELYFENDTIDYPKNLEQTNILVKGASSLSICFLSLEVWKPNDKVSHFKYESIKRYPIVEFIIGQLAILGLLFLLHKKMRHSLITNFRKKERKRYDEYQIKRTENIFELLSKTESARELAESGKIANALIEVNEVLQIKPSFKEAIELKKLLLLSENAGKPVLSVPENLYRSPIIQESNSVLYLKIIGTPYAYQAPKHLAIIKIGRQKRKLGEKINKGNDIVIRVPGSDNKSLRISREHLQIQYINGEYFVLDKSKGNTKLNGKKLNSELPKRILSGDKLAIADIFILEVAIRSPLLAKKMDKIIQFNSKNTDDNILMEATLGDMLTECPE